MYETSANDNGYVEASNDAFALVVAFRECFYRIRVGPLALFASSVTSDACKRLQVEEDG